MGNKGNYAIIIWEKEDYVNFLKNANGSIMLFQKIKSADAYADKIDPRGDSSRVISIEGVKE